MNLQCVIETYNIKNCLIDVNCSSLLEKRKGMKVDILPEISRKEGKKMLLDNQLESKYDLIITSLEQLDTFSLFFFKSLFIFIPMTSDVLAENKHLPYDSIYENLNCYQGKLYRNDYTSTKFYTEKLGLAEQEFLRDKPHRFLMKELELLNNEFGQDAKKVILELGSSVGWLA